LIALFGVDESGQAALRAVRAGLDMLKGVQKMGVFLEEIYGTTLQIGIGIHYGEAVVGSIGDKLSKRMTAIGDAVNLASRIEAATKACGAQLLVSEEMHRAIRSRVRVGKKHPDVHLKGKSNRHTLYEIVGLKSRNATKRASTPHA
jgi:adenylate cyclase